MSGLNYARSNFGSNNMQFYYSLMNGDENLSYYKGELTFSDEALANQTVDYTTHGNINVDQ